MRLRKNRVFALGAMVTTTAMLTAGCLSGGDDGGGGGDGGSATGGGTTDGDGVVEILGAFGGVEQDSFEEEMEAWAEESGIEIQYTGTQDFQTIITSKVRSGDTPDIAIYPQPGTLIQMAEDGDVAAVDDYADAGQIEDAMIPGLMDAGKTEDGTAYAVPMRVAVKSNVFVPREFWEQGGYPEEPGTIQELIEISDKIKGEGTAPWCIGYGSDAATGWVGTDWIEEYMLRLHGPEVYDQWVTNELPFDSPEVQEAFDAYAEIVKGEGYVRGGARAIINTPFAESFNPAFEDPPKCILHRQGNFITGFLPDDIQQNLDDEVHVFYFPPYEGGYDGSPVLGGGDLAASFNSDDEDTTAVLEFLSGQEFGTNNWAADGGWLSPRSDFDTSLYPDETTRQVGQIAAEADVFRFDASDLMPTEVGGGTFWSGMVEWTQGGKTTEEVTQDIQESWPAG
ncbi:MAG TPA: ABC transporter substrate-binding protein [Nocardioidaceae bacterium]